MLDGLDLSRVMYTLVQKFESIAKSADKTVGSWITRTEGRNQLARMSDRMLQDVGLNRIDVAKEVDKYFWQR